MVSESHPVHPLGTRATVLLSSVFGPYAQDDDYGSRKVNPIELYHNQVTRVQGVFSLRMFHRSFGLMMMQENIEAPCTLLDFPTLERFVEEVRDHRYDIVGISSIIPNLGKVVKMCEVVRQYLPDATIVVGGHIGSVPGLKKRIGADHICRGDGVRWFQRFLGQDEGSPVKHPAVISGFDIRIMGVPLPGKSTAATLIPSAGCPVGCGFCSTSALFGGKGKFVNFYESGDALFSVICGIEEKLGAQSFFVLDENFLLHRDRALRLLELMEEHQKSWSFYVFSSGRVLKSYTIEQLIGLGISWVWMGLEGQDSQYRKLSGVDTRGLVRDLQAHGIRVLGSTIIGLEDHCPENIDEVIDWAVSHDTDFHQFMLYTPYPGTDLYRQHLEEGRLLADGECDPADTHGQYRFNFRHEHIPPGLESEYLLRAFQRDFEVNGPSIARLIRTILIGWRRHKNHPNARVRRRFERESARLSDSYAGSIWAIEKWYRKDPVLSGKMSTTLRELYSEFGWRVRALAPLVGGWMYLSMRREAKRLENGWCREPATFYEKNARAREADLTDA